MSELVRTQINLRPLDFSTGNKRRTPGLHLTDVIRDIMISSGKDRSRKNAFDEDQLAAFQLQGYLWEDVFTEKLRDYLQPGQFAALGLDEPGEYVRLGEIACNGTRSFFLEYDERTGELIEPVPPGFIIMSPDGMRIYPERLLELKWTTLSATMSPEEKRPEWFYQVKCYLYALSLALESWIIEVEWPVFFACGDYKGSGPIHELWLKQFSRTELSDSWNLVTGHAQYKGWL